MSRLREKIIDADAYVIGAPNYYSTINAITHAFLERLYQFRHQEGDLLWGKLAVAVGVGGMDGKFPSDDIERFLMYSFIETVEKVSGKGAAACYSCGYGETCGVGIPVMLYGKGVKITPESIPDVSKEQEIMEKAGDAGRLLAKRLTAGHDRKIVTQDMQQSLMDILKSST